MKLVSDVFRFSTISTGGPQAAEGADKRQTQALFGFGRTTFSHVLISQHVTLILLQVFFFSVQTVIVQTSNNLNSARTISRPGTK
jgi:hypothetical protein